MDLKPGTRLRSLVCATEVIVIRGPGDEEAELTCGGETMSPATDSPAGLRPVAAGQDGGTVLGKRYTQEKSDSLEVLVTRAGSGTLAYGGAPLVIKSARVLPSSD